MDDAIRIILSIVVPVGFVALGAYWLCNAETIAVERFQDKGAAGVRVMGVVAIAAGLALASVLLTT